MLIYVMSYVAIIFTICAYSYLWFIGDFGYWCLLYSLSSYAILWMCFVYLYTKWYWFR